jgi:hypothetical protein
VTVYTDTILNVPPFVDNLKIKKNRDDRRQISTYDFVATASDSIEEIKEIEETEKHLQSRIIRMENQMPRSTFDVGEIFLLALQTSILKLTNNKNITFSIAMCQADAVMASNIVSKSCDILLTSDSDQAAILGEQCVCVKNFKIIEEKKKTKINNIEIFLQTKQHMKVPKIYLTYHRIRHNWK